MAEVSVFRALDKDAVRRLGSRTHSLGWRVSRSQIVDDECRLSLEITVCSPLEEALEESISYSESLVIVEAQK